MKTYRAVIQYDGTDFHGVAEQLNGPDEPNIRTVVGELRPIIAMVAQSEPHIIVSGRTDKGVHAKHQVISFTFPDNEDIDLDCGRLAHVINRKLNPEIVVQSAEVAEPDFHARFSAKARIYRYFINNTELPDFVSARYSWHIVQPLNVEAMEKAAQHFVGEKDFTSVCKDDVSTPHNIREVFAAAFIDSQPVIPSLSRDLVSRPGLGASVRPNMVCFEITANAYCWNMVRSILGVIVLVGKGEVTADSIPALLAAKERAYGSHMAPPQGLFLWDIQY